MIAISITSLGFGDVVPTTHFGRFIVSCVSVVGVVMVGIFISTVQSRMMVSEVEKRIFYNVRMKKLKTLKTECAANLVQAAWRYYKTKHVARRQRWSVDLGDPRSESSRRLSISRLTKSSVKKENNSCDSSEKQSVVLLNSDEKIKTIPHRERPKIKNDFTSLVLIILYQHRLQTALYNWVNIRTKCKEHVHDQDSNNDLAAKIFHVEAKVDKLQGSMNLILNRLEDLGVDGNRRPTRNRQQSRISANSVKLKNFTEEAHQQGIRKYN